MLRTQDIVLQLEASRKLIRYYVTRAPGNNIYFTAWSDAKEYADSIGAEVKTLD